MKRAALLTAAIATLAAHPSAQDWPQYLGPNRNGIADAAVPRGATLSEAWRRPLPSGGAGIAVSKGRVYTSGSDGTTDYLFALEAATGKDVWRAALGETLPDAMDGPGATPAVAGDIVIAIGTGCRIVGVRTQDGAEAWQRNLGDEYKSRFAARAGCNMSPVVSGNLVVVPTGAQEGVRLVALDAASGKQVWAASEIPSSLNGGPGLSKIEGAALVLYHHAKPPGVSGVTALRADTGATVWQLDLKDGISDTTPLPIASNRVLLQTWKNASVIEIAHGGPRVLWTTTDLPAAGAPPVYRDGYLYGLGGTSSEYLTCLDAATGEVRWSTKAYRGSVLLAGSTLVMLSESSGLVRLVDANPTEYREIARLQALTPGARTFTAPSYAEGRIFIRNLDEIVAIALKTS